MAGTSTVASRKICRHLKCTMRRCVKAVECVTRNSRISFKTKESLKKQGKMKLAPHSNVEFTILSWVVRCWMKENFGKSRGTRLLEAVEKCNSLRKCRQKSVLHEQLTTATNSEDGNPKRYGTCNELFIFIVHMPLPTLQNRRSEARRCNFS